MKVVVVGCGNVGMAYANALVHTKTHVTELVLVDINSNKAEGEAMDLNHCLNYCDSHLKIKSGTYADAENAKIVCLCAGANQQVGETRTDLILKNKKIFESIITEINKTNFNGFYLVATNPLDVMTMLTLKLSKFNKNQVIGSGTTLDTSRLRYEFSEVLGVHPKSVNAYVLGEHGDSQFALVSDATVGGLKLNTLLSEKQINNISEKVKNLAYDIIKLKGATFYGIATCLVEITNAILNDANKVLPVSSYHPNLGVALSLPTIVNANGASQVINCSFSKKEEKAFKNTIKVIKENANSINLKI